MVVGVWWWCGGGNGGGGGGGSGAAGGGGGWCVVVLCGGNGATVYFVPNKVVRGLLFYKKVILRLVQSHRGQKRERG